MLKGQNQSEANQTRRLGLSVGPEPLSAAEMRTLLGLMQRFADTGSFMFLLIYTL